MNQAELKLQLISKKEELAELQRKYFKNKISKTEFEKEKEQLQYWVKFFENKLK